MCDCGPESVPIHVLLSCSFVISFYLSNDTIQIFEPVQRNSGIVGGKFLERRKLAKPGPSAGYYLVQDLFVGSQIATIGRFASL